MRLTAEQLASHRERGHLTLPGVFDEADVLRALDDATAWAEETVSGLSEAERAWYLEPGAAGRAVVRKLDNPVSERLLFRALAADPRLVAPVEQLIGEGVSIAFSQIFFKPPEVGGPKPVHQDNFYFGCEPRDGMVTAWVALDEATIENGCLWFGEGSNKGPVLPHVAPPDRPYDLQLGDQEAARHAMTPAPVPRGGVSFHHGNTLHRSSDNRSKRWRRACAIHYVNAATRFATPALDYDLNLMVRVS